MENKKMMDLEGMETIYRFAYEFSYTTKEVQIARLLLKARNNWLCDDDMGLYQIHLLQEVHTMIELHQNGVISFDLKKLREEAENNG